MLKFLWFIISSSIPSVTFYLFFKVIIAKEKGGGLREASLLIVFVHAPPKTPYTISQKPKERKEEKEEVHAIIGVDFVKAKAYLAPSYQKIKTEKSSK